MVTAFYQMVGEEAPKRRQGQGQWGPLQNPFFSTQSMPFVNCTFTLLASTNIVTMGNCLCPLLSIWDYVHLPTLYQIYSCKIACNTACQVRSVLGSGCLAMHAIVMLDHCNIIPLTCLAVPTALWEGYLMHLAHSSNVASGT